LAIFEGMQASGILGIVWIVFRTIGAAGFSPFATWKSAFPYAFAIMLVFMAIGHFNHRRMDLHTMVPRWIVDPVAAVFVTGILELIGAAGLLFRFTRPFAVAGLVILLVAIFPANIKAAREQLRVHGKPVSPLLVRGAIQVVFILLLIWCVV
jgi:uncharacterized membrane protein